MLLLLSGWATQKFLKKYLKTYKICGDELTIHIYKPNSTDTAYHTSVSHA